MSTFKIVAMVPVYCEIKAENAGEAMYLAKKKDLSEFFLEEDAVMDFEIMDEWED